MQTKPLVSIIIDNYNYARFLKDCIDSAMQQTYQKTEVIVVDDGSTDNSRYIIDNYGKQIIPLFKSNGGQASCFNAGFKQSQGEIILFLDADDYLSSDVVKKVMESFELAHFSKIHWPLYTVNQENKLTGKTIPDDKLAEGDLREQLITCGPSKCGGPPNSPPTSGNAWSRSFLEQVLPMPETVFKGGADNYLFVLAPLFGKIKSINKPLGYYRVHGANNTLKKDYMNMFFTRFEACCEALSHYLIEQGIKKDPASWPRDHWYHKVYQDMKKIADIIPPSNSFILVDENHWLTDDKVLGRKRIVFPEKDGTYWGPPEDDKAAISELENDKKKGASFIVITWPAFWWLDYYKEFHEHLQSNYNCVLKNERLIIFNLNDQ